MQTSGCATFLSVTAAIVLGCTTDGEKAGPAEIASAMANASAYQTFSGDFTGDGRDDVAICSATATGIFAEGCAMEISGGGQFASTRWNTQFAAAMRVAPLAKYDLVMGDFDGNGRKDLAAVSALAPGVWRGNVLVSLSTGNGFASSSWPSQLPAAMADGAASSYRILVGDYNGDGKDDIAVLSETALWAWQENIFVLLSTGSGFAESWRHVLLPTHMRNGGPADYRVFAGKFNADNLTDIVAVSPNAAGAWDENLMLEIATASGFSSQTLPSGAVAGMRQGGQGAVFGSAMSDIDGDQLDDLVLWSSNGVGAWESNLAVQLGGPGAMQWQASELPLHMRNGGPGPYTIGLADLNGDSLRDLWAMNRTGWGAWESNIFSQLSTGSGWLGRWTSANTPVHQRGGGNLATFVTLPVDVDGDHANELVTLSPDGAGGWNDWFALEGFERFGSLTWLAQSAAAMHTSLVEPIPAVGGLAAPCDDADKPWDYFQFQFDRCDAKRFPTFGDRTLRCPVASVSPDVMLADGRLVTYAPPQAPVTIDENALNGIVDPSVDMTVIEIIRVGGVPHFRYLSNGTSQNVVQPWSSTKFLAAANAGARLREVSGGLVGLTSSVAGVKLGDLITTIHTYNESGEFTSNGLAGYFHDIGTRERANNMLFESWLGRSREIQPGQAEAESFGGNYGASFSALPYVFDDVSGSVAINPDHSGGRQNRLSMFTLAEALKRLVLHREVPLQAMPSLTWADVQILLYGAENSAIGPWGGMSADHSIYFQAGHDIDYLQRRSHGTWRVFSKLGGGGSGEMVETGYACFPVLDGSGTPVPGLGREFVIAANYSRGDVGAWADRDRVLASAFREVITRIIDGRL